MIVMLSIVGAFGLVVVIMLLHDYLVSHPKHKHP